jgi:hypothetical protein
VTGEPERRHCTARLTGRLGAAAGPGFRVIMPIIMMIVLLVVNFLKSLEAHDRLVTWPKTQSVTPTVLCTAGDD